jgi:hypothetical protein
VVLAAGERLAVNVTARELIDARYHQASTP